jgi:hypothetical protein
MVYTLPYTFIQCSTIIHALYQRQETRISDDKIEIFEIFNADLNTVLTCASGWDPAYGPFTWRQPRTLFTVQYCTQNPHIHLDEELVNASLSDQQCWRLQHCAHSNGACALEYKYYSTF